MFAKYECRKAKRVIIIDLIYPIIFSVLTMWTKLKIPTKSSGWGSRFPDWRRDSNLSRLTLNEKLSVQTTWIWRWRLFTSLINSCKWVVFGQLKIFDQLDIMNARTVLAASFFFVEVSSILPPCVGKSDLTWIPYI